MWLSFKIVGIPFSILLGIFLLGILTRRGTDWSNVAVMFSGVAIAGYCLWMVEHGELKIAWPWVLFFGTAWSFCVGALVPKSLSAK